MKCQFCGVPVGDNECACESCKFTMSRGLQGPDKGGGTAQTDPCEPTSAEKAEGMITRNAVQCGVCQSPAHRYSNCFQCSSNPNHMGDLNVGIFTDLTHG